MPKYLTAPDDPLEIDVLDRRILQLIIDRPTIKDAEMGKIIGVKPAAIKRRKKKHAFIKAYNDLMATTDELMVRAQKLAARRLLAFIKDDDKKIALEAMKMALAPMLNRRHLEVHKDIVFQTRIGTQGQLMQEVIEVDNSRKEDTSPKDQVQGESTDEPSDIQDKSSETSEANDNLINSQGAKDESINLSEKNG